MKRFLVIALATAAVGFAGVSFAATGDDVTDNTGTFDQGADSVAQYGVGMAANGIVATRHNVGGTGNYIAVRADVNAAGNAVIGAAFPSNDPQSKGAEGGGTSEICVFCHTPHHTVSTATGVGNGGGYAGSYGNTPMWNRQGKATGYTAYGTTIGGSNITAVGGTTLACLSCHDGVTSMDNLVNGPGENAMSDRWGGTYGDANSQGFLFADVFDSGIDGLQIGNEERINIGNAGNGYAGNGTMTADLSNDHPMSVLYSDGDTSPVSGGVGAGDSTRRASLRLRTTKISSIDLASGLYFTTASGPLGYSTEIYVNLSQNRWANKGFISDTATIEDMLREGKVECSSCHDPHFKNLSNADLVDNTVAGERYGDDPNATIRISSLASGLVPVRRATTFAKQDGLFLRRVGGNAGSGVCRTCHYK